MAQLKTLLKDSWESIVGNCDELLYLGGNEQSTHEYISKLLGKATIDTNTYGKSQGRSGSYSSNYQQSGRELLMPDEVRLLNNADALLFVRGERAMRDRKIDLLKHRNIHLTTDGGYTPYTSTSTKMQVPDISYDPARHDDYDLLTEEDLIDPSESKKPIYYEISEEN